MSMILRGQDQGYFTILTERGKRFISTFAVVAALAAGIWLSFGAPTSAGGETRTLSLYHIHTKESISVTYMVKGRYVPSAMKKINYLMRDWRRNEVIKIDPKTVDLMWELHADLGSHAPIHIICGYRSPRTNAFLKKIGRNVAGKSQHMVGKAIDLYFPDVATKKIRNSALVRKVGGVGYYRSSGGPTGFVHLDSGKVRHWGPAIGKTEMAQIFRDGRRTLGARLNRRDATAVAALDAAEEAAALQANYQGADEDLATLAEQASKTKPASEIPKDIVRGYPVPKPRPKPIEVLIMAAAKMKIEPASAPPPTQVIKTRPSIISDSLGVVEAAETMAGETSLAQTSNLTGKGSFAAALRDGTAVGAPVIQTQIAQTQIATASITEASWWQEILSFGVEKTVRRDGAPQEFSAEGMSLVPSAQAQPVSQEAATGKSDMLVVLRDGKGDMPTTISDLLSANN
jgi:uncharacterized protein YcbK (DUF882 family)